MLHALPTWKRRTASTLDTIAIFLVLTAPYIYVSGGVDAFVRGVHLSATSPARSLLLAVAVLILRHLIVWRPSFIQTAGTWWRAWRARARRHPRRFDLAALGLWLVVFGFDMGGGVEAVHVRTTLACVAALLVAFRVDVSRSAEPVERVAGRMPVFDWPTSREWIWATLLFVAATGFMLHEQVVAYTKIPDAGDPLLSMWRMAWVAHQLPLDPRHLFDANVFHPDVRTLAYSDSMLVPALLGAPFIWLGAPLVVVYTSLFLGSYVACGLSMFALVRAVTRDTGAALVAGLVFGFDIFKIAHYSHLELQFTFWMPLALLALLRTLTAGRLRDGVMTGVFIALQTLSSLYYGVFFAVSLGAVAIGWLWFVGRVEWRAVRSLAAGALIAVVVAALVTMPYRANRATVGERSRRELARFSAEGRNYLTAPPRSAMYHRLADPAAEERDLFTGTTPVVFAAAAMLSPVSPVAGPMFLGLLASVDGSLGVNGSVYRAIDTLRFRGFRAPARFRAVVGVYLALLAGLGIAGITRRIRSVPARRAALVAMGVLVLIDLRPRLSLEPFTWSPSEIYARIPDPKAVITELPMSEDAWARDFAYMYFSTFHWHPMVNGASGFYPARYERLREEAARFPSHASLDVFKALGTEYFVLHQGYYGNQYAAVVAAADGQPRLQFVASAPSSDGETRLYRLVR